MAPCHPGCSLDGDHPGPSRLARKMRQQAKDKPLAFRTAIELALKNSTTTGMARADAPTRPVSTVNPVARCFFCRKMVLGSGLGGSYGFPPQPGGARAPSIFNGEFSGSVC